MNLLLRWQVENLLYIYSVTFFKMLDIFRNLYHKACISESTIMLNGSYQLKCTTFLKCINCNNVHTPTDILLYIVRKTRLELILLSKELALHLSEINCCFQKIDKAKFTTEWLSEFCPFSFIS